MDHSHAKLKHARVVFTGRLLTIRRREALALVEQNGGEVQSDVSRRTTVVVVGMGGWPVLRDGTVSKKLERAEKFKNAGAKIEILSERAFLQRVSGDPASEAQKTYRPDQVCDLVGIEHSVLLRWDAQGLIESHDGCYDFQDIVSLRSIVELIDQGMSPSAIASMIHRLQAVLPDIERPLAQLNLIEHDGELLAELNDTLIDADGQMVLSFGTTESDDSGEFDAPVVLRLADATPHQDRALTAEEWFEIGVTCEDEERYEEAATALRRALSLEPNFPEAHFNLGNALRANGLAEAAEEHFRMALSQDPAFAEAWFNLADLQEENNRLAEAINSLRQCIAACPLFADAHFNLALFLESAGRDDEALVHWRKYLGLDTHSAWATEARKRLGRG